MILFRFYLELLSIELAGSLWNIIRNFSEDQLWWYHRTEYLVGRNLPFRRGDWRRAYKSLSENGLEFNLNQDYGSSLLISILFELGSDPTPGIRLIMKHSSEEHSLRAMKLSLARIDPSRNYDLISYAMEQEYTEVVRLLLTDGRLDPSCYKNSAIRYACHQGDPELVSLLLADKRVDPSILDNKSLAVAIQHDHVEVVRILLSDPRIIISGDEELCKAIIRDSTEIVRLLLTRADVDPSGQGANYAIKLASKRDNPEMMQLLLADKREHSELRALANRVNPTVNNNYPLRIARKYNLKNIERLLLSHPEVLRLDEENSFS